MHLESEALLDLAEGVRAESAEPHLRRCDACRRRLADLRAVLAAVVEAPDGAQVPEPSPLFWAHLSQRVRLAVAEEPSLRRGSAVPPTFELRRWWKPAMAATFLTGAVAVLVAMLAVARMPAPRPPVPAAAVAAEAAAPDLVPLPAIDPAEDPSLTLVADLAAQVDTDAVFEAGMAGQGLGVDDVVGTLTGAELSELQRLLKDELGES